MKAQRPYPTITITPKGERALLGGHPWVYDTEITAQSGPIADGPSQMYSAPKAAGSAAPFTTATAKSAAA